MWYLERIDPLPSLLRKKFISFVGAGGKTSLAEYLGRAAAAAGKRVVMTTTTKIWAKVPYVFSTTAIRKTMGKAGDSCGWASRWIRKN